MNRYFAAASACMLAIALLAGSICGPACSGALCPANSKTQQAKSGCHSMHPGADGSLSLVAQPQHCDLAAANLANLAKPVIMASRVTDRAADSLQFVYSDRFQVALRISANSLFHATDSPPSLPASPISTVVLRV